LYAIGIVIDEMLPAPAQGAVGVEVRSDDEATRALVAAIDHRDTHVCVSAERHLLAALGGTCHSPIAALATLRAGSIQLRAEILTADGSEVQAAETIFAADDAGAPAQLGRALLAQASPALRALFAD
ncbi:MAG: hydroxymethylbilane synthase, partial [Pseudomonadota bacterium]|nr:hydroxymethylbilane synthase [Pseudomonadota bacterium]